MPKLIKNRALAVDEWAMAGAEEAAAGVRRLILPLAEYLKTAGERAPDGTRAVLLNPEDQDLTSLLPHLAALPLIAIRFGSTGEGRGYTQARLLRERYGYRGELRAVGAIRADQIFFLARCGFDAFELVDGEDVGTAIAQLDRFSVAYQAAGGSLTHTRMRYGGAG